MASPCCSSGPQSPEAPLVACGPGCGLRVLNRFGAWLRKGICQQQPRRLGRLRLGRSLPRVADDTAGARVDRQRHCRAIREGAGHYE